MIALTLAMMVVEIAAGMAFGSMALLADGWHMGTHAVALGITALAYYFARRHADNPRFTFGTGKVGELGGFASAVVLAVVAIAHGGRVGAAADRAPAHPLQRSHRGGRGRADRQRGQRLHAPGPARS
ncbi:MAG: cation transporter [Desulfobacterales bacterium]|nr:cation transporter [Desulfobacterales bacterium]